jgi:hypothetical protein
MFIVSGNVDSGAKQKLNIEMNVNTTADRSSKHTNVLTFKRFD